MTLSKRLNREVFSMDRLKTKEEVTIHVDRVVLMNFLDQNKEILSDWGRLLRQNCEVSTKRAIIDSLVKTFKLIMGVKKGFIETINDEI